MMSKWVKIDSIEILFKTNQIDDFKQSFSQNIEDIGLNTTSVIQYRAEIISNGIVKAEANRYKQFFPRFYGTLKKVKENEFFLEGSFFMSRLMIINLIISLVPVLIADFMYLLSSDQQSQDMLFLVIVMAFVFTLGVWVQSSRKNRMLKVMNRTIEKYKISL